MTDEFKYINLGPKIASETGEGNAVLSLHEPFEWSFGFGPVKSCRECVRLGASEEDAAYPCATVRAIETPVNDPSLSPGE